VRVEGRAREREASLVLTPAPVTSIESSPVQPTLRVQMTLLQNECLDRVEGLPVALTRPRDRWWEQESPAAHESPQPRDSEHEEPLQLPDELRAQLDILVGGTLEAPVHRYDDPPIEPRVGLVCRPWGFVRGEEGERIRHKVEGITELVLAADWVAASNLL